MVCPKCGSQVAEGRSFCMSCGSPVRSASDNRYGQGLTQSSSTQRPTQVQRPQYIQPDPSINLTSILVMGIISLAVAFMPIGSIAGIILGAIAKSRGNAYRAAGYQPSGKVNTGRALGIAGMISGIVMTVIWSIYAAGMIQLLEHYL